MVRPSERRRGKRRSKSKITLGTAVGREIAFAAGQLATRGTDEDAILKTAEEVAERLRKSGSRTRAEVSVFCDVIAPAITAGVASPLGRAVLRGPRGTIVRAAAVALSAGCTLDRIRRAGGTQSTRQVAREAAEAGLQEFLEGTLPRTLEFIEERTE